MWEALTSAEGLGGWFGDRATVDLRPATKAFERQLAVSVAAEPSTA